MRITTKSVDPYCLDARIELDAADLARAVESVKEALTGEVQVEGFRKGKAPKKLVEQKLDPAAVRSEALDHALEDSFSDAVRQQGWDVMKTTDLRIEENAADKLAYSVRVHLWPSLVLPDLSGISVPRKPVEVTDEEIDEALDTIRNMRATFLDKTGPAVEGDRVEVDFDASIGGTAIEGGSSRNHPLVIGGKNFMPGFEEELVGLAAGASKEFSLTAPGDYYESKLAGKTIAFVVTIRRVQSVLKPAADDAFAATLGSFSNIAQLRESLREGIAKEKEAKEHQRRRLAILDAIIDAAKVPAPALMAKDELDDMVHRFSHDLQGRGMELSMYLARLKKTEEDLRKDWMPEAERQSRITLVLRQVARDQKIGVTTGELDQALNETIGQLIKTGQATEDQVDPERIRSAIAERLLTEKTLEFLERTCLTA